METIKKKYFAIMDDETMGNLTTINIGFDMIDESLKWIKNESVEYKYLSEKIVNIIFPILIPNDKEIILEMLVYVLNMIYIKYGFINNGNILWTQLIQNNNLDLRAILEMMLPYISDVDGKKRQKLESLEDIYLKKDTNNKYIYSNSQYNRCIRKFDSYNPNRIIEKPYIHEYLFQHTKLLLHSIDVIANKLYINWIDVLPIPISEYNTTQLYLDTIKKIMIPITESSKVNITFIDSFIDTSPGLSFRDIYNVIINHLYYEVASIKWLIFDIFIENQNEPIQFLDYLDNHFETKNIWDGLLWSQLTESQTDEFAANWKSIVDSTNRVDNIVFLEIYNFFEQNYVDAPKLKRTGELKIRTISDEDIDMRNKNIITKKRLLSARDGMYLVSPSDIYTFFSDEFRKFKKTWYYHARQNKKKYVFGSGKFDNVTIYVTPKNVYNYAKSMIHVNNKALGFIVMEKSWDSLDTRENMLIFLHRLLDIPNKSRGIARNMWKDKIPNWFNIKKNIERVYGSKISKYAPEINFMIHQFIRPNLVDIIFESMIYHGLLSKFIPTPEITNDVAISSKLGTDDDNIIKKYKQKIILDKHFESSEKINMYMKNSYYYLTGDTYGNLKLSDSYYKILTTKENWHFLYAMNWLSQINFINHYSNSAVMYVTGSTGVGKSTQVPKLLLYAQKIIEYNPDGKIICTQPRIPPTENNAITISSQLGLPILNDSLQKTSNYIVQYKHSKSSHDLKVPNFLKIVTDGTLYQQLINSPFLTKTIKDTAVDIHGENRDWIKKYTSKNIYDIVIVDESHEHNPNMDMILTLMRDTIYINNSVKLVIISATMDDDELIYRRYYRKINDNRIYPPSTYIEVNQLDRVNIDRRFHISPPGATTQYKIDVIYYTQSEQNQINIDNFVQHGIDKTIYVARNSTSGDILLFLTSVSELKTAVEKLNEDLPYNMIAFDYHGKISPDKKNIIDNISTLLHTYSINRKDLFLPKKLQRQVPPGTYTRAVIVATNIAEASLTITSLKYVIDPGYQLDVSYDPITGRMRNNRVPISTSSADQRKGRVGRVDIGTVYRLYTYDFIKNNKTSYNITQIDPTDIYTGLWITEKYDFPIITPNNDINSVRNNNNLVHLADTHNMPSFSNYMYYILNNPRPYIDIIRERYTYTGGFSGSEKITGYFYSYIGRWDDTEYSYDEIKKNLFQYISNNHDDYDFIMNDTTIYNCRGYTGFRASTLEDITLQFYLIHPDENIIVRNLYSGKIIGFRYDPSVNIEYYKKLGNNISRINSLQNSIDVVKTLNKMIDPSTVYFSHKYCITLKKLQQSLAIVCDDTIPNEFRLIYPNEQNHEKYINMYFDSLRKPKQVLIKTSLYHNIEQILQKIDLKLDGIDWKLWYAFSIPNDISDIVLLLYLIMIDSNTGTLMSLVKIFDVNCNKIKCSNIPYIQKYMNKHGDIYVLWEIYNSISAILNTSEIKDVTKFSDLEIKFLSNKQKYNSGQYLDKTQKNIFKYMYESGKLNTPDEIYTYAKFMYMDDENLLDYLTNNIRIKYFIESNHLNSSFFDLIKKYIELIYSKNKNNWLYDYEISHGILDDDMTDTFLPDLIEWAKNSLNFSPIFDNSTDWELFYEIYVRTHSFNLVDHLVKTHGNSYYNINKIKLIPKNNWGYYDNSEMTFLIPKTEYIMCHGFDDESNGPMYLTPIRLEMLFKINPIAILSFINYVTDKNPAIINSMLDVIDRYHIDKELSKLNMPGITSYINKIYENISKKLKL